jgi:hypothetical protein
MLRFLLRLLEVIGCLSYNIFVQPFRFLNYISVSIVDVTFQIIPQTPPDYMIGSILTKIATENPLIWSFTSEIIDYVAPMIIIVTTVKFWKTFKPF